MKNSLSKICSRKSDSTITNVCPSVGKPPSFFILQPSVRDLLLLQVQKKTIEPKNFTLLQFFVPIFHKLWQKKLKEASFLIG